MTLSLPRRINNGDDGDADNLMEIIDALADAFPVTDTNQSAISASKVTIPSGFAWPASTVPASVVSDSGYIGSLRNLSSDPAYTRAYGIPFARMAPVSTWSAPSGGGFPAPIKDGALLPSRSNDRVYEIPRNSAGGPESTLATQITHTFSSGDSPVHAVAKDQTQAYVLCQGTSGNPHPSIKIINTGSTGGAATAWLSLGATYTSVRNICINRQGSYLYVTAKKSGDTYHRRVLRIDTSTQAVSECDTGNDYETNGICVVVNQTASSSSLGQVYVLQSRQAATYGATIWRINEASGHAYGGAFPSSASDTVYAYSGTTLLGYQMVPFRGGVVTTVSNGTSLYSAWFSYHSTPTGGGSVNVAATAKVTSVIPCAGGAWTDGDTVMAPLSTGLVFAYNPFTDNTTASVVCAPGASAVSGTYTDYSGGTYAGRCSIGSFRRDSDGTGYMFSF